MPRRPYGGRGRPQHSTNARSPLPGSAGQEWNQAMTDSTPTTYPATRADLAEWEPCERLHKRIKDARMMSRTRVGYTEADLARILECEESAVFSLESGVLDVTVDVMGTVRERPAIDMSPRVFALVDDYRRFLHACESLPTREAAPVVTEEDVSKVKVGTVDERTAEWLRKALDGHAISSGARSMNPLQRQQALGSMNVSVATLATALNIPAREVWEWLTGVSSPPLNTQGEQYWRSLDFLAQGSPVGFATSRAGRAGHIY